MTGNVASTVTLPEGILNEKVPSPLSVSSSSLPLESLTARSPSSWPASALGVRVTFWPGTAFLGDTVTEPPSIEEPSTFTGYDGSEEGAGSSGVTVSARVISFSAAASLKYLSQTSQCQYSMLPSSLAVASLAGTCPSLSPSWPSQMIVPRRFSAPSTETLPWLISVLPSGTVSDMPSGMSSAISAAMVASLGRLALPTTLPSPPLKSTLFSILSGASENISGPVVSTQDPETLTPLLEEMP